MSKQKYDKMGVHIDGLSFSVSFTHYAGSLGTYYDPPEPPEIEMTEVIWIDNDGQEIDITELVNFSDSGLHDQIENYIYENCDPYHN